jgi:hypothetical protein
VREGCACAIFAQQGRHNKQQTPTKPQPPPPKIKTKQICKKKIAQAEDGRGRFKTKSDQPLRIADREKKPALKT